MKYDLSKKEEVDNAFRKLTDLVGQHSLVDIKKVNPKRSLRQNNFLHVTFGIFGLETGYDLAESKIIYKRIANPEIYIYHKQSMIFLRSSADLTVKEMTTSVDKWRKYCAEKGIDIPAPDDEEKLRYYENRIEQEGKWL